MTFSFVRPIHRVSCPLYRGIGANRAAACQSAAMTITPLRKLVLAAAALILLCGHNASATITATTRIDNNWGSGLTGAVVLRNTGAAPVSNW